MYRCSFCVSLITAVTKAACSDASDHWGSSDMPFGPPKLTIWTPHAIYGVPRKRCKKSNGLSRESCMNCLPQPSSLGYVWMQWFYGFDITTLDLNGLLYAAHIGLILDRIEALTKTNSQRDADHRIYCDQQAGFRTLEESGQELAEQPDFEGPDFEQMIFLDKGNEILVQGTHLACRNGQNWASAITLRGNIHYNPWRGNHNPAFPSASQNADRETIDVSGGPMTSSILGDTRWLKPYVIM
ncbi:hypothetical protein DM02DRAFT_673481 [Periconia macrospinosa]|uniref:Uncharacterized protein n=1 Tax=Periconia macrospinosa TaxID=97972 RepID=A0A2V1DJF5_9PLEO|nr:hypothetical protein DM02DRAFT_673481 [Periconia macrospinosa]